MVIKIDLFIYENNYRQNIKFIVKTMDLSDCVTSFLANVATLKRQIIDGVGDTDKKIEVIYRTLKYYSECKKEILNEDYEIPKNKWIIEKKNDGDSETEVASDSDSETDSDCESEYDISDDDEDIKRKKCSLMVNSRIVLNSVRQSKIYVCINKKNVNIVLE